VLKVMAMPRRRPPTPKRDGGHKAPFPPVPEGTYASQLVSWWSHSQHFI